MYHARHRFTLLWKRLVAALSLVAAAALAPAAPTAAMAGAGGIGSRVGSGAAVANAAGALVATVAGLAESQRALSTGASDDGAKAKAHPPLLRQELVWQLPRVACTPFPARPACALPHAPRAGLTRAPPRA